MKRLFMGLIALLTVFPGSLALAGVQFNYSGRQIVAGVPYSGTGFFKFALVNADGSVTYWANDGVTLDGAEPTTPITVSLTRGFFSVNVGDTAITGMSEISPTIFTNDPIFLRVWFSDGSGYERLQPDRRIANPGLLSLKSRGGIDIYVDPLAGHDHDSGLDVQHAKKSIQAAWNALPNILETTATIHLGSGVYRESDRFGGKICAGDARILFLGNPSSPTQVRVTGANAGAETVPVRQDGFTFTNQSDVILQGLSFDRYAGSGIHMADYSNIAALDTVVHDTLGVGVYIEFHSNGRFTRFEISSTNAASPIYLQINSSCYLIDSYIHDNQNINGDEHGISALSNSTLALAHCHFANMHLCVEALYNGAVQCNANASPTLIENCATAFSIDGNGTVAFGSVACTFVNVPTHFNLGTHGPVMIF